MANETLILTAYTKEIGRVKINYIMSKRILIVLTVYTVLWISADGKSWLCGVDICTEGVHFCHGDRRICFKCADFEATCFSRLHEPNCSLWCEDNFKTKVEQKIIENTCGPLSPLQDGYVNSTNSTLHRRNDVVYFKCNPGFDRVGPESSTCLGYGHWSASPPVCRGGDPNTDGTCSAIILGVFIGLVVPFVVLFILFLLLYRKYQSQEKRLKSSTVEAASLLNSSEPDSINKTEQPTSIKVDNPSAHPEPNERGEAMVETKVPSAPPRPEAPTVPSAPPDNNDAETNPKVPIINNSERPHDSTRAIKENGIKPDRPPERPLPPRETEALQPTDDDFGERGLFPDLPSGAAGIFRLLSYHQKEEQLGHEKIALEEQIVDRQDLGD